VFGDLYLSPSSADPPLDLHWVTARLALGAAVWTARNMRRLAGEGITHVVSLQSEFDDRAIAEGSGIEVHWAPFEDDLQEKPPEVFRGPVAFARAAWRIPGSKIYFHCAQGVHRSPMVMLAFLVSEGMSLENARRLIERGRPYARFPDAYVNSVRRFLEA
jgi:protein-tyrosine phosphatase